MLNARCAMNRLVGHLGGCRWSTPLTSAPGTRGKSPATSKGAAVAPAPAAPWPQTNRTAVLPIASWASAPDASLALLGLGVDAGLAVEASPPVCLPALQCVHVRGAHAVPVARRHVPDSVAAAGRPGRAQEPGDGLRGRRAGGVPGLPERAAKRGGGRFSLEAAEEAGRTHVVLGPGAGRPRGHTQRRARERGDDELLQEAAWSADGGDHRRLPPRSDVRHAPLQHGAHAHQVRVHGGQDRGRQDHLRDQPRDAGEPGQRALHQVERVGLRARHPPPNRAPARLCVPRWHGYDRGPGDTGTGRLQRHALAPDPGHPRAQGVPDRARHAVHLRAVPAEVVGGGGASPSPPRRRHSCLTAKVRTAAR
ncbi:hypothetical protein ON010_g17366 [Phytophthora cinnamomi]|nr:hypothetical protein ON010_g17366 [Phytophthora cinnamomi]